MAAHAKLDGLVAATYTPLRHDGSLNLDQVEPLVERLLGGGVRGLYVCGSTGEGVSLTREERMATAEAFVQANKSRVPILVQVGHNSLREAQLLAAHAQEIGADAISATCPSYFAIPKVDDLVDSMRELASAASATPFYYYHIPVMTGVDHDMTEFLARGAEKIPTLVGLKFTTPRLHDYLSCTQVFGGCFDVLWGTDEMLLGALATGARAAVGSTYNIAAPLYVRLIDAHERGDLEEARRLQTLSVQMIETIAAFPFHAAMKEVLRMQGVDVGGCRLPQPKIDTADVDRLRERLQAIGFFDFAWRTESAGELAS